MGRRWAAAGAAGVAVVLAGACSGGGGTEAKSQKAAAAAAQVAISPANGTSKARPDKGVTVTANGGKLQQVAVTANGKPVEGQLSPDGVVWKTKWALKPGASVEVNATAKNAEGKTINQSSKFRTEKYNGPSPAASLDWIQQGNQGKDYGVGLPIILNFDQPVFNKTAVKNALEVKAEKPVEGAWRWLSDTQVVYRTKTYWPAHQKVTVNGHLAGVRMGKGVYGKADFNRTFKIGENKTTKINLRSKKATTYIDGKKKWKYGISAGNGQTSEYTTSSGKSVAMEKGRLVIMESPNRKKGDPGYYKLPIEFAVRFTSSGQYVHKTKGEEYCLGRRNCSHGCVRQPSKQALWYFNNVQVGDPIITTGSRRKTDAANGWSYFQMSFSEWKKDPRAKGS